MKYISTIVLILNLITSSTCSALSKALSDVIYELFIFDQIHFDIIVYGNITDHVMDTLDDVGKELEGNFSGKLKFFNRTNWNHEIEDSAVILVSPHQNVFFLLKRVKLTNSFPKNFKFLIFYEDEKLRPVGVSHFNKLNNGKGEFQQFMYYLVDSPKILELISIEWFAKGFCNELHFKTLNKFGKTIGKWYEKLTIKPRFRNFHGCELALCFASYETSPNEFYKTELFTGMSSKGNFFAQVKIMNVHKVNRTNALNYTLGDCQMIFGGIRHISLSDHSTIKFELVTSNFILTPYKPYSAFEKLLLPFDETTWILLTIVFIYAFASIPIINFVSHKMKNAIFGNNVTTPGFNIVAILFGIGQTKLPEANFPRILLTTFLWFCLIFRTAYQSLLIEYEATDIRKSLPQTIDDLYEHNFTIFKRPLSASIFLEHIGAERRPSIKNVSNEEFAAELDNYRNNEGANIAFLMIQVAPTKTLMKDMIYDLPYELMNENLITFMKGVEFEPNNFLYNLANEVIQDLVTGGILEHLLQTKIYLGILNSKYRNPDANDEKKPITYEELSYGFSLWMLACFICYIAFLFELTTYYIKMEPIYHIRNFFGLWGLLKTLFVRYWK